MGSRNDEGVRELRTPQMKNVQMHLKRTAVCNCKFIQQFCSVDIWYV
jgi:hypothetical protein